MIAGAQEGRPTGVSRLAVVLHPDLTQGLAACVAGLLVGGLRCDAFDSPIADVDAHLHVAITCNLVVLRAKTEGQLHTLLTRAKDADVPAVAFTRLGQRLSNSYAEYRDAIRNGGTQELGVIGVGLFGPHDVMSEMTRSFSLFR
ncbi:MAG TPA: DUF2000 family protein [Vicinamibacterales bacterium]|nr:DUF2000 family protein [Vicinamibacterales bacterium]